MTAEHHRLEENRQRIVNWKRWGSFVSERAWGTVREDYSAYGTAWDYLPHDQARSKAYRWGEDGILGFCDRHQFICFAPAFWNGHDPILKERLFGLNGEEGNHGEDVKEYYYYLDNTPTHSYMKALYKYPQAAYPYAQLVEENRRRSRHDPEYELIETGIFDENRYFDVFVEYAKASPEDILIRMTVINCGPDPAELDLLPTLWFRNTWSWKSNSPRPVLNRDDQQAESAHSPSTVIKAEQDYYGQRWLYCERTPALLFTENETNLERLYGVPNASPYVKDSINDYLVHGKQDAVNPAQVGTKVAAHYHLMLAAGQSRSIQLRCITFALIDPDFAKEQLILLLREWYMHPNGQLPAYEWALSDVNPPVHALAAYLVYSIEKQRTGKGDRQFLEKIFHKLLLNFTWWVNRKDYEGKNVFQGGFLGLDNIGVFDRNLILPNGSHLEQSDATSWMGMYCLNMLTIALELAHEEPTFDDIASKFFEHFVYIAHAMNDLGQDGIELWDEQDGFYYDVLYGGNYKHIPIRVRSMVGLIPLLAVSILEFDLLESLPAFKRRMQWFMENWSDINEHIEIASHDGNEKRMLLSLVNHKRLPRVLNIMLDESEFLSDYGLRGLSRSYKDHPYSVEIGGIENRIDYEPAESTTELFGGNSNWRGPIWFPLNYLIIDSLRCFYHFYGDAFKVEFPTGSGPSRRWKRWQVSSRTA